MSARRVSHGPAAASRDRLTSRPYTAKDAVFEQILNDAGVYGHRYDAEVPSNLEEIKERLLRPRRSLSPSRFSRQEFRNFQAHVHDAKEESDVRRNVIPVLAGQNVTIASAKNRSFKGLPPLTKANIADAKPDFYDGSGPWDLNQRVLDEIGDKIIPCPEKNLPLLPNFFLEAKGPMAPFPIGFRQALQDNGLGARAMDSLRFYGEPGSKTYDKKALSISTVYQSGRLDLYGTYSTPPSAGADQDGSQMIEIDCWRLDRDWDGFRRGASAFRNAREWAKEQRDEAIRCANAKAVALARGGSAADTDESGVPGAVEEHDRGGAAPGPGWCWWGW
ncbi:MAG: hypothetical protein M1817_004138 [Caeruleum heppii]|nr:MAG: hypothetical protein M1817_004138 [Caeruleum heppii]